MRRLAPTEVARRRPRTRMLSVAAAVVVATAFVAVFVADTALGAPPLLVNSLGLGADANPGDGLCQTATVGECTLRAALEEANVDQVADTIGLDPGFAGGTIVLPDDNSYWMTTANIYTGGSMTATASRDNGAVFAITSPVTIDLEHRLSARPAVGVDGPDGALFYINDTLGVRISGVDDSYSGRTTFLVGPSAYEVTITDGEVTTLDSNPRRFLVVRGGAVDVTVSDYILRGYAYGNDSTQGWGWVDGAGTTPVDGLTITGVTYRAAASGTCGAAGADACFSAPLRAEGQRINRLEFSGNTVENLGRSSSTPDSRALSLRSSTIRELIVDGNTFTNPMVRSGEALIDLGTGSGATITDFEITDNTFTGVSTAAEEMNGVVRLPAAKGIGGTGLISRNTFVGLDTGMHAIYWHGPHGDTQNVTASGVVIEQNQFDGFGDNSSRATIRLYQTGAVTMRHNTFGTGSGSQTSTANEEGIASGNFDTTLVSNWSYGANGKMNTWFPTATTSANVKTVIQAQACVVPLEVAPPTDSAYGHATLASAARMPAYPAVLDVYWTAGATAEVYLGEFTVSSAARRTLDVALPADPADPRLAQLPSGAVLPVNPATGAVTGGLRLQTQDPNAGATAASSQYSRVAEIGGTCAPVLTIGRAATQADSTMARDLHFTLTSTMALDVDSLTVADIDLTGSTGLNPRIVSITPSQDGTSFDIVARVDDSGTVTVAVAAGAVTGTLGLDNPQAATSTDRVVTYVNPLQVSPMQFPLVTGEPNGKNYTLGIKTGAPLPAADLEFTSALDAAAQEHGVQPATLAPVIPAGEESVAVNVTAAAGEVTPNTVTTISHTVASDDPNYDGLVVPSVRPHLYSTDPVIHIGKAVYTGVTGANTAENIIATGTPMASGSHLADATPVWFVFTVTNTSADEWATSLSNITVRDDVLGQIGTIATLPAGQSRQLVYAQNPVAIAANGPVPTEP